MMTDSSIMFHTEQPDDSSAALDDFPDGIVSVLRREELQLRVVDATKRMVISGDSQAGSNGSCPCRQRQECYEKSCKTKIPKHRLLRRHISLS